MKEKISACVITKNEEANIGRCLRSLSWCDEIVVVDSFSSDRTVEIAREHTDSVLQHEWSGYVAQKRWAWEQTSGDWLFWVDADEEVSAELRDEIQNRLDAGSLPDGFDMPRRVHYLGRWIRHGNWYPDRKLRLFRRTAVRLPERAIHERAEVDGRVEHLRHPLHHYTYDSVEDQIRTLVRYSALAAREKSAAGGQCRATDLMLRPAVAFLRGYLLKQGVLDGRRGLMIAVMNAVETALKYVRLRELDLTCSENSRQEETSP